MQQAKKRNGRRKKNRVDNARIHHVLTMSTALSSTAGSFSGLSLLSRCVERRATPMPAAPVMIELTMALNEVASVSVRAPGKNIKQTDQYIAHTATPNHHHKLQHPPHHPRHCVHAATPTKMNAMIRRSVKESLAMMRYSCARLMPIKCMDVVAMSCSNNDMAAANCSSLMSAICASSSPLSPRLASSSSSASSSSAPNPTRVNSSRALCREISMLKYLSASRNSSETPPATTHTPHHHTQHAHTHTPVVCEPPFGSATNHTFHRRCSRTEAQQP